MRRTTLAAASATALLAALSGTDVLAAGFVTSPLADYNAALVKAAGGKLTVPFDTPLPSQIYTVANDGGLSTGSGFTITLPSNWVFVTSPNPISSSGGLFEQTTGLSGGTNSISYKVATSIIPPGATVSIGGFSISGASQLETPFASPVLSMTIQATGSIFGLDDAAPIEVPVFINAPGAVLKILRTGGGGINLASIPPGTQFVADAVSSADAGAVATLVVATERTDPLNNGAMVITPAGVPNTLNPNDSVSITVKGDFTGIESAYASPTIGTCAAATPAGAYGGSVTREALVFAGVPIDKPVQICIVPDGETLMQPGTKGYTFSYAVDSGTDFTAGLSQTMADSGFTYVGGSAQIVSNFFTGADSGYASVLRVSNAGKGAASLVAEFQPYSGGNLLVGSLGTIAAGTGTTFTLAQLEAAVPGLSLANSGQRATLTLVGSGVNSNVSASAILVEPGGLLGNIE
jgi:hypothetical protein